MEESSERIEHYSLKDDSPSTAKVNSVLDFGVRVYSYISDDQ